MHRVGFIVVFVVLSLRHPELWGVGIGLTVGFATIYFIYRLLGGNGNPFDLWDISGALFWILILILPLLIFGSGFREMFVMVVGLFIAAIVYARQSET